MNNFDDPLDLFDDDGDGVVEMSLLEEEEKQKLIKQKGNKNHSGCSFVLFLISSLVFSAGWFISLIIYLR